MVWLIDDFVLFSYTTGDFLNEKTNLWPIWTTSEESLSFLDPPVFRDLCIAESNTQNALSESALCGGCYDGGCLPPVSLVSLARLLVGDNSLSLDCDVLTQQWESSLPTVRSHMLSVVAKMRDGSHDDAWKMDFSDPYNAIALLVDSGFGVDGNEKVRFTSSIFATSYSKKPVQDVFNVRDKLDRGEFSHNIKGSFDTPGEDFGKLITDTLLLSDMKLVIGSLVVTTSVIFLHTRSIWLTCIGLAQITLSFPLAYLFYRVVLGFDFFPFLNFIGLFVVFAIGADDIFVAVDKWKNARIRHPDATVSELAGIAFPSAARAMLLTTVRPNYGCSSRERHPNVFDRSRQRSLFLLLQSVPFLP